MFRFVNPFTDIGFKIIFGQPTSKDLKDFEKRENFMIGMDKIFQLL